MKIIECPRDAMQGMEQFIPSTLKAEYINLLLQAGFDTIDFGSFVSPKAVPQMRDTAEVLEKLNVPDSARLLAIVANLRGAVDASEFETINYLGYPLSVSETFQVRNTNKTIGESLNILNDIQELCHAKNKKLVVYLSMGFGNPYGDPYEEEIVLKFTDLLVTLEVETVSISDTIGVARPKTISDLYSLVSSNFPDVELGCHLHSRPEEAIEKIEAAYLAGCRRIDGAILGYGGCPMAKDELVGNLRTETIVEVMNNFGVDHGINEELLKECILKASEVFK